MSASDPDDDDPARWDRIAANIAGPIDDRSHSSANGNNGHQSALELFAADGTTSTAPPSWLGEAPPAEGEHLTEMGNARRLVRRHGEDMRYCHDWSKWLVWDGKRWKRDNTGEAPRRAKQTVASIYAEAMNAEETGERKALASWAIKSERSASVSAMLKLAESEPRIPVEASALDADPMVLNVGNGSVDLRSGSLRPHRRADMMTKIANADYDPSAKAPLWLEFLRRIFSGSESLIDFVQSWCGYCLTGDVSEHCMVVAYGTGRNGKSTLFETMAKILGDYAGTIPSAMLMARNNEPHPTERALLLGLRLARASETKAGQSLDEAMMKRLTGGDRIDARRMNEDFWDFEPTHKIVMYTNHPPRIKTSDEGTWSKLRLLPFRVTIPESDRDHGMKDRLYAERAGILAWAIEGASKWAAGGLVDCPEVRAATQEYRTEQDTLGPWLEERCVLGSQWSEPAKALFASYKEWAKDQGEEKPVSQNSFGRILTERGLQRRPGSAQRRLGVRLLSPIEIEARQKSEEASAVPDSPAWQEREPGEDG